MHVCKRNKIFRFLEDFRRLILTEYCSVKKFRIKRGKINMWKFLADVIGVNKIYVVLFIKNKIIFLV